MENQTYRKEFQLLMFSANSDYTLLTFFIFSLLYVFGVFLNSIIIAVIYVDAQLHTPMYLFLCNLALVDICYTTTTVSKLLYMLLSGDNTVSFTQCFTQMYFYIMSVSTEDVIIFIMAYDRYVAICHPLHYHSILNQTKCLLLAFGAWILGYLNSFLLTRLVSHMCFCHSHAVQQFFCDPKALFNISCGGRKEFYLYIYLEILVLAFLPITFSVISYIKIFRVISHIQSMDRRKKAFSTCLSHLTVIIIYYITAMSVYVMPPSEHSSLLEPVLTAVYSVITPMLNPLIYSLRNTDVKKALLRLMGVKQSIKQ